MKLERFLGKLTIIPIIFKTLILYNYILYKLYDFIIIFHILLSKKLVLIHNVILFSVSIEVFRLIPKELTNYNPFICNILLLRQRLNYLVIRLTHLGKEGADHPKVQAPSFLYFTGNYYEKGYVKIKYYSLVMPFKNFYFNN